MATVHTLKLALERMADLARRYNYPLPTIATDLTSARILVEALAADLGCDPDDLIPSDRKNGVYAMYDGVSIVALIPIICKRPVDGWREHFGALAEILEA